MRKGSDARRRWPPSGSRQEAASADRSSPLNHGSHLSSESSWGFAVMALAPLEDARKHVHGTTWTPAGVPLTAADVLKVAFFPCPSSPARRLRPRQTVCLAKLLSPRFSLPLFVFPLFVLPLALSMPAAVTKREGVKTECVKTGGEADTKTFSCFSQNSGRARSAKCATCTRLLLSLPALFRSYTAHASLAA
jgi:hypothetical protein